MDSMLETFAPPTPNNEWYSKPGSTIQSVQEDLK